MSSISPYPPSAVGKDVRNWSKDDVASWLEDNGFGEHKFIFIMNDIAGVEMIELQENELRNTLKIEKLGDRKKLMRAIKYLETKIYRSNSSSSSNSDGSWGTIPNTSTNYVFKCSLRDDIRIFELDSLELDAIREKASHEFEQEVLLKFKDEEGDFITIQSAEELALSRTRNGGYRLYLQPLSFLSEAETRTMDSLMQSIIITDEKGNIVFFNKAATDLFGYPKKKVIGKNIKKLLTPDDASAHAAYLKSIIKSTKKKKNNGCSRNVNCLTSDGNSFIARLSVSESNTGDKRYFTTTIQQVDPPLTKSASATLVSPFTILDTLIDAAVVIDSDSSIQFYNTRCEDLFGYSKDETIGNNINMLISSVFQASRMVNRRNIVTIQSKSRGQFTVQMNLTQQDMNGKTYYTAIIPLKGSTTVKNTTTTTTTTTNIVHQQREFINGLLIPALIIDANGTLQAFNEPASKVLGYSLCDVIGRNISFLTNQKVNGAFMQLGESKITLRKVDGSELDCKLVVNKKEEGNKVFYSDILLPQA